MVWTGAMQAYGFAMSGGGIAFVYFPSILRELLRQTLHIDVALGLGKDGSGGNVGESAIALDKGATFHRAPLTESIAVDDDGTGRD